MIYISPSNVVKRGLCQQYNLGGIMQCIKIYKLQCALFVHDYMPNKLPISFNDSFTKTANPNSRQSSNLFRHRPRTTFSSRLPKHKFPVIWNSLGHDHHTIASRNIFKKNIEKIIVRQLYTSRSSLLKSTVS